MDYFSFHQQLENLQTQASSKPHGVSHNAFAPPYVVIGDHLALVAFTQEKAYAWAQKNAYHHHTMVSADDVNAWQNIQAQFTENDLFAQTPWLSICVTSAKIPKASVDVLMACLQKKYAFFLHLPYMDKAARQLKWFIELQKHAQVLDLPYALDEAFVKKYLQQQIHARQLQADAQVITLLYAHYGDNLLDMNNALEHLSLACAQQSINMAEVQNLLKPQHTYDMYDLLNAMWHGDVSMCAQIYNYAQAHIAAPLFIWGLMDDAMKLLDMMHRTYYKIPYTMAEYRFWGAREQAIRQAQKRLSAQAIKKALKALADIDQQMKGVQTPLLETWQALYALVYDIARYQRI